MTGSFPRHSVQPHIFNRPESNPRPAYQAAITMPMPCVAPVTRKDLPGSYTREHAQRRAEQQSMRTFSPLVCGIILSRLGCIHENVGMRNGNMGFRNLEVRKKLPHPSTELQSAPRTKQSPSTNSFLCMPPYCTTRAALNAAQCRRIVDG